MKNLLSIILISILFNSCQKVANIKLEEAPEQLVVEAQLTTNPDDSFVKITKSKGLKGTFGQYDLISNVQVVAKGSQGNQIIFQADSNGVYKTTQPAIENSEYTIEITQGDKKVKGKQKLLNKVEIDNIVVEKELDDNNNEIIKLNIYFDDNPQEDDYYILKYKNQSYPDYISTMFADYELYENQNHRVIIYSYDSGMTDVEVKLYHIQKQTFDFFYTLRQIGGNSNVGGIFSSSVAGNPEMNIENGIGYFMAAPVSTRNVHINP